MSIAPDRLTSPALGVCNILANRYKRRWASVGCIASHRLLSVFVTFLQTVTKEDEHRARSPHIAGSLNQLLARIRLVLVEDGHPFRQHRHLLRYLLFRLFFPNRHLCSPNQTHATHTLLDNLNFTLPKRRFWKSEQSVACAFLNEFSMTSRPNRVLTPVKSTSKPHTQRFVRSSKIFVWGA